MTALDTNVVVRLILLDTPHQTERAREVAAAGPCFVPDTVLLESAWVLRTRGGLSDREIAAELRFLLDLPTVSVRDEPAIRAALGDAEAGLDIADAFHRALSHGADRVVTFDRRFANAAAPRPGVPVEAL